MTTVYIGCGQLTWNRNLFTEDQILGEIAQAGYDGAPAGPYGGRMADEATNTFGRHGLKPAPGYLGANFWLPQEREQILSDAERFAVFARDTGCTELYVAAGGFEGYIGRSGRNRKQVAGHVAPNDMMTDEEFKRFADTLNEVGATTLRYGVRSCFHNHVGSVIETGEETERLLEMTDPNVVFLGPDTGHLAWAGVDSVAFFRKHAARIKTAHLKDVVESVRQRGVAEEWDYNTFTSNGVFAELGDGDVDFPAIVEILRANDFSGWLIVETDVTQRPTALESAVVSREYLRTLGL